MTTTTDRRALFLAAFTMLVWGLAGSFVRLIAVRFAGTATIVPFAILSGRLLGALVVLFSVLLTFTPRDLWQRTLPALRRSETWTAAAFQFVYYLLAVTAFMFAPVSEIALCASTAPLWVLLIRRLRGQTITGNELLGAILALSGVALIVLPNLLQHPVVGKANAFPYRTFGDVLSLGSAFVTGIYALVQHRFVARGISVEPRALSLATFLLGLPLLWFLRPVPLTVLCVPSTIGLFAGLSVLSTVLPTLAFAIASRHLPPVMTATLALLLPVFATTYAAFLLREAPPVTLIPGGALVLFGLWYILRPVPPK